MPNIFGDSLNQLLQSAVVQLFMAPILIFIFERMLGSKFDKLGAKRDEQRREDNEREKAIAEWRNAASEGLRSVLRAELMREHRKAIAQGYCDVESKEYIVRTYNSYHRLGGNGLGTRLYEEIVELPSKPPRKEVCDHCEYANDQLGG